MHFTTERKRLVKMLEIIRRKWPGQRIKERDVRLYACAARVFVSANEIVAGEESLVLADGGCVLRLDQFLAILKSYADKPNVTIQADENCLTLFRTTMPIRRYTTEVAPPADFYVGRVTDVWVAGHPAPTA